MKSSRAQQFEESSLNSLHNEMDKDRTVGMTSGRAARDIRTASILGKDSFNLHMSHLVWSPIVFDLACFYPTITIEKYIHHQNAERKYTYTHTAPGLMDTRNSPKL